MKSKAVSGIMLTLLLTGMLTLAFDIQLVTAAPYTIYVDASNIADPLEDGTIDHPFDKIQEGIDAVSNGDAILVAAGIYYENITLKNGIRVEGADSTVTTINGREAENVVLAEWVVNPATAISGFTVMNGTNGIHVKNSNLTISNCIVTGNEGDGIRVENSNPTITNCTVTDNNSGISCDNSNPTITYCTIEDNGNRGIYIYSSSATITGCIVRRNLWAQISAGSPNVLESSLNITNCVITDGEHMGVDLYFSSANITNCLIAGFDWTGIYPAYSCGTITNSILWANGRDLIPVTWRYEWQIVSITYSDIANIDYGEGNYLYHDCISIYPMFVNPGAGDFRLLPGSPCIDAGTNQGAPTVDMEGTPRPFDGDGDGTATTDMGPYEYTGPPPPPPERPPEVWVDDDWAGYSPGDPVDGHVFGTDAFSKIQDGIDAVASPGTVYVATGTYYESIVLKDGARVEGAGADVTTIDGCGAGNVVLGEWLVNPDSVFSGFTVTNGTNGIRLTKYSLITISNCIVWGNEGDGIRVENSNPTITNCTVTDNNSGISCDNSNPTITYCTVTDHGSRGIFIDRSIVAITGCTVSRNVWFQIEVGPESFANITNCVITNGEHDGISVYDWYGGYTNNATITNCLIAGFDGSGIGGAYVNTVTVVNCILWANGGDLGEGTGFYVTVTYSDIEDGAPGEGNICADPMFVDAAGGDFHLQAGSPCIDAGTNEDVPSIDFEGNLRPIDGDGDGIAVVDMGAYEFIPPQCTLTIYSSPTGVTFAVDGVSHTTPWLGTYYKGASVSLVMPETQNGYVWSHWLEDGDTDRTKTVTVDTDIMLTAVYTEVPKPVGGKAIPINILMNEPETSTFLIWLSTIILSMALTVVYVKKRNRHTEINSKTNNKRTS